VNGYKLEHIHVGFLRTGVLPHASKEVCEEGRKGAQEEGPSRLGNRRATSFLEVLDPLLPFFQIRGLTWGFLAAAVGSVFQPVACS
jgi:hypothetical protein